MEKEHFNEAEDAVVQLLTQSQVSLRFYIRTLVPDAMATEDILQDVNIEIWHHAAVYDPSRPFLPWARSFAYFKVMKYRQDCRRDRLVFDDELVNELGQRMADETDGFESEPSAVRLAALEKCLASLKGRDREILLAHYYEHKNVRQLMKVFQLTKPAVVSLLYRIRQALFHCIVKKLCRMKGAHDE